MTREQLKAMANTEHFELGLEVVDGIHPVSGSAEEWVQSLHDRFKLFADEPEGDYLVQFNPGAADPKLAAYHGLAHTLFREKLELRKPPRSAYTLQRILGNVTLYGLADSRQDGSITWAEYRGYYWYGGVPEHLARSFNSTAEA